MKLSISLNKPKVSQNKQPVFQRSAFGANAEDDLEPDAGISAKGPVAHAAETSKAMQKRMNAEKRVDSTVYEYDEVWDKIQEAKQRQQAAKEADVTARKVCSNSSCCFVHQIHNVSAQIYPGSHNLSCYT